MSPGFKKHPAFDDAVTVGLIGSLMPLAANVDAEATSSPTHTTLWLKGYTLPKSNKVNPPRFLLWEVRKEYWGVYKGTLGIGEGSLVAFVPSLGVKILSS